MSDKGAADMAPKNGITLDKIVHAATEMIDREGVEALTLASLAQKLEVRSPSLYNHFDGLHDLRRCLSLYGLKQLHDALMRAAIGRSGDEAIRAIAKAYLAFVRKHSGLYEMTLMFPPDHDEQLQKASQEIVDVVTQVLEAYSVDQTIRIHLARSLRSMLHGFAALEQKAGFRLAVDRDDSLTHMIDTFLAGIHVRYL